MLEWIILRKMEKFLAAVAHDDFFNNFFFSKKNMIRYYQQMCRVGKQHLLKKKKRNLSSFYPTSLSRAMLPSQKCCRKVAKETTYFQAWYQSENLMRAAAFLLFTENFVVNHLRHIVKAKSKSFRETTTSTHHHFI